MRYDVIGIGENSIDDVYVLDAPPAPGTKSVARRHTRRFGGQVATTLCTCAAFGLRTAYVGVFGHDPDAGALRSALASRGVDLAHAVARAVPNRRALVLVEAANGERTIYGLRDPELVLAPGELDPAVLTRTRLLHVDATDPDAAIAAARLARRAAIPVTCDIDTAGEAAVAVLEAVSIPILAGPVLAALTGETDAERGLRALRLSHPGPLCVTLGPAGAALLERDTLHQASGVPVEAIDTTGAGDVFRGAFIYGLLQGDPLDRVLRRATLAAALSCTVEGAIDGVPAGREVERRLSSLPR